MPIVQQIKSQYCAEDMLAYADQVCSFDFSFSGAISEEERLAIGRGLQELAVSSEEGAALHLSVDREDGALRLLAESTAPERHECILFPDEEGQMAALRWTVYGIVTGAPWYAKLREKKVHGRLFGAEQQTLAAALLECAERWQTGTANPRKQLAKLVESKTRSFVRQGPSFTRQPVRQEVWNSYDYLFRRKGSRGQARQLIREIFGEGDYLKQLKRYCGFLRGTDDYREVLRSSGASFRKEMYQQPIAGLQSALHAAAEELKEKYRDALGAEMPVTGELSLDRLSPDALESTFRELESWYRKQLDIMVRECFLEDLLDDSAEQLRREIYDARRSIQNINQELRAFCALPIDGDLDLPQLKLGWDRIINLDELQLSVPHVTWDAEKLYRLQLKNTGLSDVWLTSTVLAQATADKDSQFERSTFGVPSLSDQTVVLLTTE